MKKARNFSATKRNEEKRWVVLNSDGSVIDGYFLTEAQAFEAARFLAAHNPPNEYTVARFVSGIRTGSAEVHVTNYYGY